MSIRKNVTLLENIILENDLQFNLPQYFNQEVDDQIAVLAKHGRDATLFDIVKAEKYWGYADAMSLKVLAQIHQYWFNPGNVINSERNLLAEPQSSDWKSGFKNALAKYLIQNGTVVSFPESTYGWEDYDIKTNDEKNPIVAVLSAQEDSWSNFVDTYTGNEDKVGISGEVVFKNGLNRLVRYEAEFTDILKGITEY